LTEPAKGSYPTRRRSSAKTLRRAQRPEQSVLYCQSLANGGDKPKGAALKIPNGKGGEVDEPTDHKKHGKIDAKRLRHDFEPRH
jgi:hypothetical protein